MYGGLLAIKDCFAQKELIKDKFGAVWSKSQKAWLTAPSEDKVNTLVKIGANIDKDVYKSIGVKHQLHDLLDKIKNKAYVANDKFEDLFVTEFDGEPFSLMEHQVFGANFANEIYKAGDTGCMLSMEMGTGKTLTAMAMIGRQYKEGNFDKLLVVCPKVAMKVWENEFKKFAKFDYTVACLQGTQKKRIDTAP